MAEAPTKQNDAAEVERNAKEAADKAVELARAAEKAAFEHQRAKEAAEAKARENQRQSDADARADALDERIAALSGAMSELVNLLKGSVAKGRSEHGHLDYTVSFVSHVENIASEAAAWIKRTS